jgi:hypothetical protein
MIIDSFTDMTTKIQQEMEESRYLWINGGYNPVVRAPHQTGHLHIMVVPMNCF